MYLGCRQAPPGPLRIAAPGPPCARRAAYRRLPGVLGLADRQALSQPPSAPPSSPPSRLHRPDLDPRGGGRRVGRGLDNPRGGSAEWTLEAPPHLHSWTRQPAPRNGRKGFTSQMSTARVSRQREAGEDDSRPTAAGRQSTAWAPLSLRVDGKLRTGNLIGPAVSVGVLLPCKGGSASPAPSPVSSRPGRSEPLSAEQLLEAASLLLRPLFERSRATCRRKPRATTTEPRVPLWESLRTNRPSLGRLSEGCGYIDRVMARLRHTGAQKQAAEIRESTIHLRRQMRHDQRFQQIAGRAIDQLGLLEHRSAEIVAAEDAVDCSLTSRDLDELRRRATNGDEAALAEWCRREVPVAA